MTTFQIEKTYTKIAGTGFDKRKFRIGQSEEDRTIKDIMEAFERIGVSDSLTISRDLIKMKNIYRLNKEMLAVVYRYFQTRDFDLGNCFHKFDDDFQEQLDLISTWNLFRGKLEDERIIFKFRQDFLVYLFLIDDLLGVQDPSEEG